jgi:hypothetical protein
MKRGSKGVYCLEIGEWFGSMKKRHSVEPILQLLHQSPLQVPYIHRDIATEPELRFYLRKWIQCRHRGYPILYLAFHGSAGCIHLSKENGRSVQVNTDDIFGLLSDSCRGRIIHFGACSVLNIHGNTVNRYLRLSGAAAISGYGADVDWVNSTLFDLLYLSELQANQFTRPGLRAVRNRVALTASRLGKSLMFNIRIKK